jgi:hypothetical protein
MYCVAVAGMAVVKLTMHPRVLQWNEVFQGRRTRWVAASCCSPRRCESGTFAPAGGITRECTGSGRRYSFCLQACHRAGPAADQAYVMRPQRDSSTEAPSERPVPLEYAPHQERRGWKYWMARFLSRLSKPMPLAMYYVIMFALSMIAFVLAVIIRVIVSAFQ